MSPKLNQLFIGPHHNPFVTDVSDLADKQNKEKTSLAVVITNYYSTTVNL